MARKLKVYRTSIGFHDAYVAAPSQKAALAAWGADANLFARGVAEEVTDEALTAEPLARPGEVVRIVRGTLADHLAALPETPQKAAPDKTAPEQRQVRAAKKQPRPSRDELGVAEQAIEDAQAEHQAVMHDLMKREAALVKERREAERTQTRLLERLQRKRADVEARYNADVAGWRAR